MPKGTWVFAVFLFFAFLGNKILYDGMVGAGATCYVWIGPGEPDSPPPPCPYLEPEK